MTKTYKFNDKSFYRSNQASKNIKIVLLVLALLILVATLDLSMIQVVSESAKFI